MKKQKGFTLIELLAVLGIIVTVGAVASAIIFSSLRAATKTNQVNLITQNGNLAIQQITRTIQYAKSFDGVSQDGQNFTTNCTTQSLSSPLPSPTPTPVPIQYSAVSVTLFDESQVTFACSPPDQPTDLTSSTSGTTTDLIDTNSVLVSQCYFTCSQDYITAAPSIGISLILSQIGSPSFAEKNTSIPFNTSVTMRNSNK